MMSFSQFRPEKEQMKQIRCFEAALKQIQDEALRKRFKFILVGSCRNQDDENLLLGLKQYVANRQLGDKVEFVKNPAFTDLHAIFSKCAIGLHMMEAEHFGITIVEMMSAGLITIAHNSAGPKMDTIGDAACGFLCETEEEYIAAILASIQMIEKKLHLQMI